MTIEKSHGKARPTLPRAADLKPPPPADEPSGNRDTRGRFQSGNDIGRGRAWKHIVAKHVGRELKGEAEPLAREAWQLFCARLREMPHDGPTVRTLLADACRSHVLAARYATHAAEVGLDTDAGRKSLELSMKLSARAERTSVTALDVASALAESRPRVSAVSAVEQIRAAAAAARARPTEPIETIGAEVRS